MSAARYLLSRPSGRAAVALFAAGLAFLIIAAATWAYCSAGAHYDVAAQQALVMATLGFGALATLAVAPGAPSGAPSGPRHPQPSHPANPTPVTPTSPRPAPTKAVTA